MGGFVIWLVAACLLGIGEMHQGGFYLLPFSVGAGLAAVVSLLGVGALLSAIVFIAASGIVFAVWTARSYDDDEVIDVGERVEVVEIRGATALVMH
jgi:membrane protein implicated in regulation of membrane protease activity